MPDSHDIVINTGPLIAIAAGLGDLSVLQSLYNRVFVTHEVANEMSNARAFASHPFQNADWLNKITKPQEIASYLTNSLDLGEASVIQFALDKKIKKVCIDETVGRRVARLHGLTVTGSIGILIRAKKEGHNFSMRSAIEKMQQKGVWLSKNLIALALRETGEL